MNYGTEKWSLTMGLIRRLKVTQGKRTMLGVSFGDQIGDEEICRQTKVTDIA